MSNDPFGDSFSGGGAGNRTFFKPEDYVGAYVLMIEPKSYRDAPNPFKEGELRGEVLADITAFASEAHLASKAPTETPGVTINQTYLAGDLRGSLGKVEVYKLAQQPSKTPGRRASWVWRPVEGEVVEKVKEFYFAREESITESLQSDDVPEYLRQPA